MEYLLLKLYELAVVILGAIFVYVVCRTVYGWNR